MLINESVRQRKYLNSKVQTSDHLNVTMLPVNAIFKVGRDFKQGFIVALHNGSIMMQKEKFCCELMPE